MTATGNALTRITFNATGRTGRSIDALMAASGDNKTDAINGALRLAATPALLCPPGRHRACPGPRRHHPRRAPSLTQTIEGITMSKIWWRLADVSALAEHAIHTPTTNPAAPPPHRH